MTEAPNFPASPLRSELKFIFGAFFLLHSSFYLECWRFTPIFPRRQSYAMTLYLRQDKGSCDKTQLARLRDGKVRITASQLAAMSVKAPPEFPYTGRTGHYRLALTRRDWLQSQF